MNKLKVMIPQEIIEYSFRGIDVTEAKNNDKLIEQLLIAKAKLDYLEDSIELIIVTKQEQ